MRTRYGKEVSREMFANKLGVMVNQFYKILPIREAEEPSLGRYMTSLLREMLGMKDLIEALDHDAQYLTLLAILEYMIDNDCDVSTVRSDVFRAINILKRMQSRFSDGNGGDCDGRMGEV